MDAVLKLPFNVTSHLSIELRTSTVNYLYPNEFLVYVKKIY